MFLARMVGRPLRQAIQNLSFVVILRPFRDQDFEGGMTAESMLLLSACLFLFLRSRVSRDQCSLTAGLLQARQLRKLPSLTCVLSYTSHP